MDWFSLIPIEEMVTGTAEAAADLVADSTGSGDQEEISKEKMQSIIDTTNQMKGQSNPTPKWAYGVAAAGVLLVIWTLTRG